MYENKAENKLWLSGVFLPSHKIWAINSNSIVWGFPIFSLAALSNKLISCGELGMFLVCHVFSPLPNAQIPSFFPQRNKSKVLRSSAQLCMCISFYTWKWFIFVSVPLMLRHVSYFIRHQKTAEKLLSWQARGWLTLKIPKPTGSLPPSLCLWSYWFDLSWDSEVWFFVVPTTEIMAGSKQTKLSDRRTIFKHAALYINKSKATWTWNLVTVSGELLVFDEHYQRQMHSGWEKLCRVRWNYNAQTDKESENNTEEYESLSRANVCSTSVGQLCKSAPQTIICNISF